MLSWLDIPRYTTLFESLGPDPLDGKLSGAIAKQEMLKSSICSPLLYVDLSSFR